MMNPSIRAPIKHPALTPSEKLDLVACLCAVASRAVVSLVGAPFRGRRGAPTIYQHVLFQAVRRLCERSSVNQLQYINLNDEENYRDFVKARGLRPSTVELADGTTAYRLGVESAPKTILYFHGGGFQLPASNDHLLFLKHLRDSMDPGGQTVAALMVAYDLGTKNTYPRQLQQAVALLDHLINVLGKRPSEIILAGDSAGGNLVLAVLSHLSHPHPKINELEISEKLRGAMLLSPWVALDCHADSMRRNGAKDVVSASTLTNWAAIFTNGDPLDAYNHPITAPYDWWRDLHVEDIIMACGANEIMNDDHRAFAKILEAAHPSTTTVIAPNEPHTAPIIFRLIGLKSNGLQDQALTSWMVQHA
ncbi:MAG: hypothetical protein M1826_004225 [Phylliscum demangeonii]|nr:MAG: hypothetical protein M1826_004225 [Phylliscum demangeonii]